MAPIKEWFGVYNVIYNWFEKKYGYSELENYWKYIADACYGENVEIFRKKGLKGIKEYFESVFMLDDGEIKCCLEDGRRMELQIVKCPDHEFFKSSENKYFKPIKSYCMHHAVINARLAEKSGYKFRMPECDCKGKCKWVFEAEEQNGQVVI